LVRLQPVPIIINNLNINSILLNLLVFKNWDEQSIVFVYKKYYINHIYIFFYKNFRNILIFFKYSLNNYFLSLIDLTVTDITRTNQYNSFYFIKNNLQLFFDKILMINVINYKNNLRIIFNCFLNKNFLFFSIENLFFNSNWIEREIIEFFNINILSKKDTRNLLLDYNFIGNPLLKNFPTEGYQEIYFNFDTYNLDYINVEFTIL
jgi:NADH dehydrogenase (ubiquinone) Fe-S protein 3